MQSTKHNMLYVAMATLDNKSDGVFLKIEGQIHGFLQQYDEVQFFAYSADGISVRKYHKAGYTDTLIRKSEKSSDRILFWTALHKYLQKESFEFVYIRYPVIDVLVLRALKTMRRMNKDACIIMEIPSYPLEADQHKGLKRVLFCLDSVLHDRCRLYINKIVYIGDKTDRIFRCKTQLIPNGYPKSLLDCKTTGYTYYDDKIVMIAVSTMQIWHGYDRVIEGLHIYYDKAEHNKEIQLILVGDGRFRAEYEDLVRKYNLEKYVLFTGKLAGKALDDVYSKATIGISSLGCYRKNLKMNSPLKTKEYMIRGLPYIYGYEEIGLPKSYKYALKVSNNGSPIDMDEVIRFVDDVEKNKNKEEITQAMRQFTMEEFSWERIVSCIEKE